jgi:hypothetical protein
VFKLDGADPDAWPGTLADARAPIERTKAAAKQRLLGMQNQ